MFSPASSLDIYFFGFHLSSNLFRYSDFSLLTLRCFNAEYIMYFAATFFIKGNRINYYY
nr:MAG TPA: hypothetical protein [Caudoviricetes sp.]